MNENSWSENATQSYEFGCLGVPQVAIFVVVLCSFGILSNAVTIFIFTRPRLRRSPVNILLAGLSFADIIALAASLPTFGLLRADLRSELIYEYHPYIVKYIYPIASIGQSASCWTFILVALQRFLAVHDPLQSLRICTLLRSKILLAMIYIAAVSYNAARFWEYEIEYPNDTATIDISPLLRDYWVYNIYVTVLYPLLHFFIPFIALFALNTGIIITLKKAKKRRAHLTTLSHKDGRTGRMMVTLIMTFLVTHSPLLVVSAFEAVDPLYFNVCPNMLVIDVGNLLIVFNAASTAFFYYFFIQKFKMCLHQIAVCGYKHQWIVIKSPEHLLFTLRRLPTNNEGISRSPTPLRSTYNVPGSTRASSNRAKTSCAPQHKPHLTENNDIMIMIH